MENTIKTGENKTERFVLYTIAYDGSFYEAEGINEAYEYIIENNILNPMIFQPNTNLLCNELNALEYEEKVTVTIIKDSGEHMLFTGLAPYQALWLDDRIQDDEYINVFKTSTGIDRKAFMKLVESENDAKGIKLFGADIWIVVQEYLSMYEYGVIFRGSDKLTRVDLQRHTDSEDMTFIEFIKGISSIWDCKKTEEDNELVNYFEETHERLTDYIQEHEIFDSLVVRIKCPIEEWEFLYTVKNTNKYVLEKLIMEYNHAYNEDEYGDNCVSYLRLKGIKIEEIKPSVTFTI